MAVHVPNMIEKLYSRKKCLILLFNQGFELSHNLDGFITDRHLSNSTSRNNEYSDSVFIKLIGRI